MIYELRMYKVLPGRLPDALGRFRELPAIFERCGLRNLGRWQILSGADTPSVAYLMGFNDFAEREAQWAEFYANAGWHTLRAKSNDGEEIVYRSDLIFMRAAPFWRPNKVGDATLGGVHELQVFKTGAGQAARANVLLQDVYLPAVAANGGEVMLVADLVSGVDLPGLALMTAWPDLAAWQNARTAIQHDSSLSGRLRSDRADGLGEAIGPSKLWLLEPVGDPFPRARLSLNSTEQT